RRLPHAMDRRRSRALRVSPRPVAGAARTARRRNRPQRALERAGSGRFGWCHRGRGGDSDLRWALLCVFLYPTALRPLRRQGSEVTISTGARLGPYEIVGALGAGGMGEVYRAKDPRLGREVAIKVLPASFSEDPDRLKRFEQEARAAGVLNHPNITAVYDIGSAEGAPYIVTELLEGETLRNRLLSGPLSVRKAIDYAVQIAKGLAAAHEKGIVHRDLKPENRFVTNDRRRKILDLGRANLTQPEAGAEQVTELPTGT